MSSSPSLTEPDRASTGPGYPWKLVGLLWFCGFFNYADRQAVNAVFPLLQSEFGLSKAQQGVVASSFMWVYALAGPVAGYLVDNASRRTLIVSGLGFWSLIAGLTGTARSFLQLILYRAAEGLGESVYFPATMSILSDYHGPTTRSRAMGLHQTSVYCGIVGGSVFAGYLAERAGWRVPFYVLGAVGFVYSIALIRLIVEPRRGATEAKPRDVRTADLGSNLIAIARNPAAVALMLAFVCANFVTVTLFTWLPSFVHERFAMGLMRDNLTATFFLQGGSLVGALIGGFSADRALRRTRGGRMFVQAAGLICGGPFVWLVGQTHSLPMLVLGLIAVGLAKGAYEANIFASLYDVIDPGLRGTAAGLLNTVGWAGASLGPVLIGYLGDRNGLGVAIASTAAVYAVGGLIAIAAGVLAIRAGGRAAVVDEMG